MYECCFPCIYRKRTVKTRTYLVSWWHSTWKAFKEIILVMFVLTLAANILLFTLAQRTFRRLVFHLMQGYDCLTSLLLCYLSETVLLPIIATYIMLTNIQWKEHEMILCYVKQLQCLCVNCFWHEKPSFIYACETNWLYLWIWYRFKFMCC